ncbi:MAG: DedA family protein [Rhodocyclaceae bacterium]|nr:DedA family protein [Rhodocyclaceae bacterium]
MSADSQILQLIQQWGYVLVFLGALLEGETMLLLAGLAAHNGHLALPVIMATAVAGGFLGDQIFFFLGRRYGKPLLARFPSLRGPATRADALLARYHAPFILANRFLYGLRIAGPIAVGMSALPAARYALINLAGAVIWALVIVGAGYLFGQAVELLLGDMRRIEEGLMGGVVLAAVIIWAVKRLRRR